jgi:hypothetical protein
LILKQVDLIRDFPLCAKLSVKLQLLSDDKKTV